jgi:hypothetical protein
MTLIRAGHLIDQIDKTEYPVLRDPCPDRRLRCGLTHYVTVDVQYREKLEAAFVKILKKGRRMEKGYPMAHRNMSGTRHSLALSDPPRTCPIDPTKLHLELLELKDGLEITELVCAVKNLPPKNYPIPVPHKIKKESM